MTWLLAAFAGVALLLGVLGIYGVLAFSVQRRAREIGVRLALGARPAQVRARVLRDGALLISLGVAVGIPVALLLGRTLQGLLYGVGTTDPVSLVTAPALLGSAGLLAAFLPALRASRVDPATTLSTAAVRMRGRSADSSSRSRAWTSSRLPRARIFQSPSVESRGR